MKHKFNNLLQINDNQLIVQLNINYLLIYQLKHMHPVDILFHYIKYMSSLLDFFQQSLFYKSIYCNRCPLSRRNSINYIHNLLCRYHTICLNKLVYQLICFVQINF